jgi:Putative Flp pilus-assembly TadE/G-like
MSTESRAGAEREENENMMIGPEGHHVPHERGGARRRRRVRRRGVALIWSALMILLLIGFVGLSIDFAKLYFNVHQLQIAADSAALAGAQIVEVNSPDETRLQTQALGLDNYTEALPVTLRLTAQADPYVDDPSVDIILGRWISQFREFYPTLDTPDAVKVIARRDASLGATAPALAMIFGPIFGVDTANASRVAVGWHNAASGAGLIVLDDDPNTGPPTYAPQPGLHVGGTAKVHVVDGSIQVNSTWTGVKSDAAMYVQNGAQMLCGRVTVTGNADPAPGDGTWDSIWTNDAGVQVPYDISEEMPPMPDPLRNLVPPDYTDSTTYPVRSYDEQTMGSVTLDPGYYPGGIAVTATGTSITLNPGTYILGGGTGTQSKGLVQTGGTLTGHGVLIYLTKDYVDAAAGNWAQLDIGGNVITDITPPGDEVTPKIKDGLPGVSVWQDRANTDETASLHGGAGMMISGTLYFPNNHVYLAGVPGKAGNQILCGSVEVHGTAEIVVDYDGRNNQHKGRSILVQ